MNQFRLRFTQSLALSRYVLQLATFERYVHGLGLTVLAGLALSFVLSELAISGQVEVLGHLTLSITELFGVIIVLTMAPRLIIDGMNNRQIYLLLARPLPRSTFVTGSYFGLVLFIGLSTLALGLTTTLLRVTQGGQIYPVWFAAMGSIFLAQTTLMAAAMFFSTFSSILLSAFFTFGLYVGGNGISLITQYAQLKTGLAKQVLLIVARLLPNFEGINLKLAAVYNLPWLEKGYCLATINCVAWQILFVLAASIVLSRRNLK